MQLIEKAAVEHVAFRVETLADLKYWHQEVKRENVPGVMAANHGTQVGFMIKDSAGRLIEIYWPTGRTDIEASVAPIDLELSDDEILAAVNAILPRGGARRVKDGGPRRTRTTYLCGSSP